MDISIEAIKEIFSIKPILQGVIASLLFWGLYKLGGFVVSKALVSISKYSNRLQANLVRMEGARLAIKYYGERKDINQQTFWYSISLEHAVKNCVKAFIFLTLSLSIGYFFKAAYFVGALIALYYFFIASMAFKSTKGVKGERLKEEVVALTDKLKELENEN